MDLNPFAVAIARFRLLLAALKISGIRRLADAPAFQFNLTAGDSLLHGEHAVAQQIPMEHAPDAHYYATENQGELDRILKKWHYHAVVGNPPYITVKDPGLNQAYRNLYHSCHMKYSLAVPFMERFFELTYKAVRTGDDGELVTDNGMAGFTGMITSNSFMKREFGKKLIETYLPRWDLTHVIDTSGAYIPGHGTPTVILFGRNRRPVAPEIRAVMGIKGEPTTPADPACGLVWTSIVESLDTAGASTEFVSVSDAPRANFHKHPWSIGGGGAAELKELIDEAASETLASLVESVGYASFPGLDDPFIVDAQTLSRRAVSSSMIKPYIDGEAVRDWTMSEEQAALVPYDNTFEEIPYTPDSGWGKHLWPFRTPLGNVKTFGQKTRNEVGQSWWVWYRWIPRKYKKTLSIAFSNVATHNHFVMDYGGKVFNGHAPVIKLLQDADKDAHLALIGLLNSSTACFWGRQIFFPKGGYGSGKWEERLEWDGTKLQQFPLPREKPLELARELDNLAQELAAVSPAELARGGAPEVKQWHTARSLAADLRAQMIALQEELDWACYRCYGLVQSSKFKVQSSKPADVPPVNLGERAFEIVMARKMAAGELKTTWFARHGSAPVSEIPAHWPPEYQELVAQRIRLIETDANLRLIEQPEYKRRWNTEPWDKQAARALREWLLNRLEDPRYWQREELTTTERLADQVRHDAEWLQVAAMYRGRQDFDLSNLVAELVKAEAVPYLPRLRYKESGLRKREQWERTWEAQRAEDSRGEGEKGSGGETAAPPNPQSAIRSPPLEVPPKYQSADFLETGFWRLRGKLDVPKERFISYPGAARAVDPSLVIAWAGWNHLQQAQALANYYVHAKNNEGWAENRLVPLLAGLGELLPWLKQWHNELNPVYGYQMGDYFAGFVADEARALGLTAERVKQAGSGQ